MSAKRCLEADGSAAGGVGGGANEHSSVASENPPVGLELTIFGLEVQRLVH